jgi:hypothetical protein
MVARKRDHGLAKGLQTDIFEGIAPSTEKRRSFLLSILDALPIQETGRPSQAYLYQV